MKFHENPSSGSRFVPYGRRDGETDMTKLMVSLVSCIYFLFIFVNCKLVYDLKMAKHGRNMSSSNQ